MLSILLNTLYVMNIKAFLRLDHDCVRILQDRKTLKSIPLLKLSGLVVGDRVTITPALLAKCSERGVAVSWFDGIGRFSGALRSKTTGNVLLRLAQYRAYDDPQRKREIADTFVRAKLINARHTLLRRAREADEEDRLVLRKAQNSLDTSMEKIPLMKDLVALRGLEGGSAHVYFQSFNSILRTDEFAYTERSRRPPLDCLNAVLSFLYTLLVHDCAAACDGVGLDPQVGFLHEVRSGKPACALDLIEELRSCLVDRLVFTLVNRRQLQPEKHFRRELSGAVFLNKEGRGLVIDAYQKKKKLHVPHPHLSKSIPFGLVPHIQARLLARTLRGDVPQYVPFEYRG